MTLANSAAAAFITAAALFSAHAVAVDGVTLIDQNKARGGNVTPGDTPGFPILITLEGSYRLSGNLTLPDLQTTAIVVQAPNVTIDLNGFAILGPNVCDGSLSCSANGGGTGILANAGGLTVSNGTVQGMAGRGISCFSDCIVQRVIARHNTVGISIGSGLISDSVASRNQLGFSVNAGVLRHSTATGNGIGAEASNASTVIGNTIAFNATLGLSMGGSDSGGYSQNAFDNATNVVGGVSLGHNMCGAASC